MWIRVDKDKIINISDCNSLFVRNDGVICCSGDNGNADFLASYENKADAIIAFNDICSQIGANEQLIEIKLDDSLDFKTLKERAR